MITRTLAGHVITPAGVGVIKGAVRITPVMPVPADSSGILVPTSATYQINDGVVVGTIVAPATYNFEVFAGDALVWRFTRSVAAVASDVTLQDIYLSAVELPTIAPAVVREGDNITRLGSGTEAAGRVPAANGAGGIIWSNAGAGDMTTAVYDPDRDGKVIAAVNADTVPWSGVAGRPSTYPPEAHASSHASGGSDAVSPAAIGAAAASHTHTGGDITSQVASAASAATVPWGGITGKPSEYPPTAHEHAASAITSGVLAPVRGGTGQDSGTWSGVPKVTAGVWSVGAAANDVNAVPIDAGIVGVSASRELTSTDAGKILECTGTITLTAPNGMNAGFQVAVVNVGSGIVTLAATGTLQSKNSRTKLSAQYAAATLYHRGSNVWLAIGDLST